MTQNLTPLYILPRGRAENSPHEFALWPMNLRTSTLAVLLPVGWGEGARRADEGRVHGGRAFLDANHRTGPGTPLDEFWDGLNMQNTSYLPSPGRVYGLKPPGRYIPLCKADLRSTFSSLETSLWTVSHSSGILGASHGRIEQKRTGQKRALAPTRGSASDAVQFHAGHGGEIGRLL